MYIAVGILAATTGLSVGVLFFKPDHIPIMISLTMIALGQAAMMFALLRLRAKVNDVHFALSLESSLHRNGLSVTDYFYDGAAGTPSLQLYILKVVSLTKCHSVLELGSGQTTKLLSALAKQRTDLSVVSIEQDADWWAILGPQIQHERHKYYLSDLENKTVTGKSGLTFSTSWYRDLPADFFEKKYDFIIVDGPDDGLQGTEFSEYARAGLIWHLARIISESFVIIFDDADLYKHQMAIEATKAELKALGIDFLSCRVHGIKDQELIFSRNHKFLRSV